MIQLTETPIEPPAVLPSLGMISDKTTQAIGARPMLNEITNPMTEAPESTRRC